MVGEDSEITLQGRLEVTDMRRHGWACITASQITSAISLDCNVSARTVHGYSDNTPCVTNVGRQLRTSSQRGLQSPPGSSH